MGSRQSSPPDRARTPSPFVRSDRLHRRVEPALVVYAAVAGIVCLTVGTGVALVAPLGSGLARAFVALCVAGALSIVAGLLADLVIPQGHADDTPPQGLTLVRGGLMRDKPFS
jgi:hypothetical protein